MATVRRAGDVSTTATPILTSFPSLFLEQNVRNKQTAAFHQIFTSSNIPREVLIIAWASLLKGYTARDEVVFVVGHDVVSVNTMTWDIGERGRMPPEENAKILTSVSIQEEIDASTGVVAAEDGAQGVQLALRYNAATGEIAIQTRNLFPEEYLPVVGQQIQDAIARARKLKGQPSPQQDHDHSETKLSIVNEKPSLRPGQQLLHELAQSHYQGQDTALEYLGANDEVQSLTYTTLCQRAATLTSKISGLLRRQKVDPDSRIVIPVLLPQSPELYIALLAVLEAGAAFCPLALDTPEERMRFIVEDVGASMLITTAAYMSELPENLGSKVAICLVGQEEELVDNQSAFRKPIPANAAYVMYSKSTQSLHISNLFLTSSQPPAQQANPKAFFSLILQSPNLSSLTMLRSQHTAAFCNSPHLHSTSQCSKSSLLSSVDRR